MLHILLLIFLYQLFQYLKSSDDFAEIDDNGVEKLKIFSKNNLDMKDFFAKILPEISNSLRTLLKDSNIDDRVRDAKLPEECLKPFREKGNFLINIKF
jgi:hypothetical protein